MKIMEPDEQKVFINCICFLVRATAAEDRLLPNLEPGIGALVNWVENGIEPGAIIGTRAANTDPYWPGARTRPICPYPEVARWDGSAALKMPQASYVSPPSRYA